MKDKASSSEDRMRYVLKVENAYMKHAKHMKATALYMLKDEHHAEDAVHNVFEKLIRRGKCNFDLEGPEAAFYLTTSVRNEARKIYKKIYKHGYPENIDDNQSLSAELGTEDIVFRNEAIRIVTDFVKKESPVYAEMFILYYTEKNTISELAENSLMKESTVRKGIYRLKKKAAEFLRKEQ
ncbi:MAG: sigma-70 family RNA polymerase sigma factor [Clostridia bacterium]|nr:sigma-70 family RNA polymerase sigma factor [Clostridia bacterium]